MIIAWDWCRIVALASVLIARWGENRKVGRKTEIPVDGELAASVVLSPSSIIGSGVIIDQWSWINTAVQIILMIDKIIGENDAKCFLLGTLFSFRSESFPGLGLWPAHVHLQFNSTKYHQNYLIILCGLFVCLYFVLVFAVFADLLVTAEILITVTGSSVTFKKWI